MGLRIPWELALPLTLVLMAVLLPALLNHVEDLACGSMWVPIAELGRLVHLTGAHVDMSCAVIGG